jgi:hypothetical protein
VCMRARAACFSAEGRHTLSCVVRADCSEEVVIALTEASGSSEAPAWLVELTASVAINGVLACRRRRPSTALTEMGVTITLDPSC